MIANTAFLAALTLFLLLAWLAGELSFLAPHKATLFRVYGVFLAQATLLVFLNLCAIYYGLARWLFLRDTGRKLSHVDRQLIASDGVHEDVPPQLWSTRG
jgi:uncharacterized membrane protein YbhN (UPF0104 family)